MSRLSIIRSGGTSQTNSIRNNLVGGDEFPLLDFKELSQCLQECDFDANEELVSRPTGIFIRKLFEQILDTFMGLSSEYCVSTTKTLVKQHSFPSDVNGVDNENSGDEIENSDVAESVGILVLFRAANVMLQNCGILDFTLMDLMRPDAARIRRILSGVINFARFREEHLRECEPLARSSEESVQKIRSIEEHNVDLANRIDKLKERLSEDSDLDTGRRAPSQSRSTLSQLNNYNSKLEQELKKLQRSQEVLKQEHTSYKETKTILFEKLEDHHYLLGESSRELDKLKNYSSVDPLLLKRVVEDLKTNLHNSEEILRNHEVLLRKKAQSLDSIQTVEDELRNLIKLAQEILNDLKKLDQAKENMARQGDELRSKRHSSEELDVHIQRVKRQLQKLEEKIQKLRQQAHERDNNAKQRLSSLEAEYDKLSKDRLAKQEKLDRTRAENNELETLINALRYDFDTEFRNTEAAVAKLNSHIRDYLHEISNHL